jgi:hypothetical protein
MSFFHMLAGTISAGGDTVQVQTSAISDQAFTTFGSSVEAQADISFQTDGTVDELRLIGSDSLAVYNWVEPAGSAANYEIFATETNSPEFGAAYEGDTLNTWLALTSNRTFGYTITRASDGSSQAVLNIKIRKVGTTTPEFSGNVTFNVAVFTI